MKVAINKTSIQKLPTTGKQYDVHDLKLPGLLIRVSATGKKRYVCQYQRGRRTNIGDTELISPAQAREKAKEIVGNAIKGIYPNQAKKTDNITLKAFIEDIYKPWSKTHIKSFEENIAQLRYCFLTSFGQRQLKAISPLSIEQWRSSCLEKGLTSSTINRNLGRLKSALSKAVDWGFLESHPLLSIKPLKEDTTTVVRYLTEEEEKRLRQTLDDREKNIQTKRQHANEWRQQRGYPLLPDLSQYRFADYIKPMILVSINTGLRRGELFSLTWDQIDLKKRLLTLRGQHTKSGKTRYVPLNSEAWAIFKHWHEQTYRHNSLVFPSKTGQRLNNVKKSWKALLTAAQINTFRWHDMRHHFASKLVMAGVDLNTVRELLGHSSIKMTLRYAHLAPEHKAKAVEKLVVDGREVI